MKQAIKVIDDKRLDTLPKDFYATRNYADFLMDAIRSNRGDGKPFLAYLAFTAPHDPMHAPEPWQSMYRDRYNDGYEALKAERTKATKNLGLIAADAPSPKKFNQLKAWDSLDKDQQALEARGMEVYAGMMTNTDYHIGRVISFLKDIGEYDNTIVMFLSDNGPNPWVSEDYPGNRDSKWFAQFDNSLENIGHPMSHYAYGMGFGAASAGPLDLFKMTVGEGGIRSPLIISGPEIKGGRKTQAFSYVWDIMPTILDYAGVEQPQTYKGAKVEPVRGKSLKSVLNGTSKIVYQNNNFIDDKADKPVGIYQHIGRRPIAAFGNSDGDFEMLEWTTAGKGARLGVYVHHDDEKREWKYDNPSHIGQLKRGLIEAPKRGWTVISMKKDWKTIFPAK